MSIDRASLFTDLPVVFHQSWVIPKRLGSDKVNAVLLQVALALVNVKDKLYSEYKLFINYSRGHRMKQSVRVRNRTPQRIEYRCGIIRNSPAIRKEHR